MKLSEGIEQYIVRKRMTGLKYQTEETTFRAFLNCVGDVRLDEVTTQDVLMFLNGQPSVTFSWRRKHSLLMRFFEFWSFRDVIPALLMPTPRPAVRRTFVPFIYSREHIRSLLRATSRIKPRCRCSISAQTLRAAILLLYGTGATVGESLDLKLGDLDLKKGRLTINNNRYKRSRQIPLCKDLQDEMKRYVAWRSRIQAQCDRLFIKNDGHAPVYVSLNGNLRKVCKIALLRRHDGSEDQPSMQDFRPTFAVHRITSWIRNGADLNRLLPALAVYMGHAGLSSTQKYLCMTPERFRRELNKLSPMHRKKHWRDDPALMSFLASI